MTADPLLLVYGVPLGLLWLGWTMANRRRSQADASVLEDNRQAGLAEPASLHPSIDPARCLGCAACVHACPEGKILGIIDGKAALIEPTQCVGHGACQSACPTNAISLVFGTETRGVELPVVSPTFETNLPGIFIAGELGGMGLIRNAIEQGRQAIAAAGRRARETGRVEGVLDIAIVGCGPAGIAASLGAMEQGLSFVTLDQSTLGGTVAHFPRGKLVMTAPATLPLVGEVRFGEIRKEALLAFWEDVIRRTGLAPRFEERVNAIRREAGAYCLTTTNGDYRATCVILAIGRRGTPRILDVPGEELEKVVYRLIDPDQYGGKRVLVVGGGDSALEAAAQVAAQPGAEVTLCYRGNAYARARRKNREAIAALVAEGRVVQMLRTNVLAIMPGSVDVGRDGEVHRLANDQVIVCAGGVLPTALLDDIGIATETKFGTA